jgi:enterochelin esterase-like enzyme
MELDVRIPMWATAWISDFTDMERRAQPVDARRVAHYRFRLPDDARFEYAFVDASGRVRADPERGPSGTNPWYPEVSEARGPAYAPHPLADPPAPHEPYVVARYRIASRAFGTERRFAVASPSAASGALPLLVIHDGVAFARLARSADVLAALVAAGRAQPAHLLFLEPVDRGREYAWDDRHHRFVQDEVRPFVAERHPVGAGAWAVGASLGGLAAATLALRDPDAWTGVIALAGAFLGSPEDPRHHGVDHAWLPERLEAGAGGDLRWVLDVGNLDWLLAVNRRVRHALAAQGAATSYRERSAGHNWGAWRDALPEALAVALAPAPLGDAAALVRAVASSS